MTEVQRVVIKTEDANKLADEHINELINSDDYKSILEENIELSNEAQRTSIKWHKDNAKRQSVQLMLSGITNMTTISILAFLLIKHYS